MALADGTMIKKHHVALFLNTGTDSVPAWKQIKKSTDNTITMNPETMTFDYIVDESPTTEIDRYSPSLSQPITMYKGEDDYEYVFDKFFSQAVGADAHSQILVVFYGHDVATSYKAWKCDCILQMDNMNPVESTITLSINFNGTTDKGTVAVSTGVPVFSSATQTEFLLTINCKSGATNLEGTTVILNGVTKLTDASGNAVFSVIDGETYAVGAVDDAIEAADIFEADTGTTTINLALA